VFVIGNGMTKFYKPGKHDKDYPDLAHQAMKRAFRDAGVSYDKVDHAYVGYVYGDSTCGQRAVYEYGMSGIPIVNVNNNCSTGSTALWMGQQAIASGMSHCSMILGFEKMFTGSLKGFFNDRSNPLEKFVVQNLELRGPTKSPFAPSLFGNAGKEHMEKYGTKKEHFAKVAWKNHKHSVNNPYSQFRDEYTLDQIMNSATISDPLTKLQCCPTSDGAACAVICSEEFVVQHGLQDQAVEILGMALRTDKKSTFEAQSNMKLVGADMAKETAQMVYKQAGLTPNDV
jgi:sterol carrier protein 2